MGRKGSSKTRIVQAPYGLEKPCILVGWRNRYPCMGSSKNKTQILRHRAVLEQKLGRPIRNGFRACHHCDRRNCIEPSYLFEGTQSQNIVDAFNKRRMKSNWHIHDK